MSNEPSKHTESPASEILTKYIRAGFVEARKLTKEETIKHSSELREAAWNSGSELINEVVKTFFNEPPPKKYGITNPAWKILFALATELLKTFQSAFRQAEEGYYRAAFGELRDMLELIMKIKLFYEEVSEFRNWYADPNNLYTTRDMRRLSFYKNSGLNGEIEKLSNTLSNNRHSSRATLDSLGPIITNASYYRMELFEKWCKHVIILKDLALRIINLPSISAKIAAEQKQT